MRPRDSRLNAADLVAQEYASEERFLARRVALVDYVEGPNAEDIAFEAITEAAALARHCGHVERRDADGTVVLPDRAVERHLRSLVLIRGTEPLERLSQFDGPFRQRSRHSVFVAEKTR